MSYKVAVKRISWPSVHIFSKSFSPELRNFLQHFPADLHVKYSCTKTDAVQQCTWAEMCCNHWWQKCTYQQPARLFIHQVCYRRQLRLHFRLKTAGESSRDSIIRCGLWLPHCPDLRSCDFHLWESLKYKVSKNRHNLEELRNNIRRDISGIFGQELQE